MNQLNVNIKKVTLAALVALGAVVTFMPLVAQACGGGGTGPGGC